LSLLFEETRLRYGWSRRFAARDTDDAEHGDLAESAAGDEDAISVGAEVGRRDLQAVVHQRQKIVGNHAFEGVAVEETETEPEAVEFGATEEGLALGFKVVVEITHKIDRADFGKREFLVLAVWSKQVERIDLPKARGIEIAAQRLAVKQGDYDFLVSRGWGAKFQRRE